MPTTSWGRVTNFSMLSSSVVFLPALASVLREKHELDDESQHFEGL